jgi:hypothetical protein
MEGTEMQQTTNTPPQAREEMWLIILAKSKTMRFFAVSCEFIIFLGCLWLTLVTILPAATSWAQGTIDKFFLVAMGFAVDAALPEAWLHVVDQYTETPRKKAHLKWSVPIAIGMLLLVVANIVYTKLAGNSKPDAALNVVVNVLLIARMFLGISYVTIRECQSFLDRKQGRQQLPAADLDQRIAEEIASLTAQLDARLAPIAAEQARMLASIQQLQVSQTSAPAVDHQAVLTGVLAQLEPRFTSAMKRLESEIRQQVRVSAERETAQMKLSSGTSSSVSPTQNGTALAGPKLVPLPQRNAQSGTMKHAQVEREPAPSSPAGPDEATDAKSTIYRLLDQDSSRQVADLVQTTGLPKTTVWRHWNRYHEEHQTRGQGRIIDGDAEPSEAVETA